MTPVPSVVPHSGPPPGWYAPAPPTNGLALPALLCGIFVAPVGIVLGMMARKQIRETGEQGDGMALAGLIIGAVQTGFVVLFLVIWLVVVFALLGTVAAAG